MTHTLEVTGPVGQQVTAQWVEFPARRLAVIEMASCAGLSLVPQDLRDHRPPSRAHSLPRLPRSYPPMPATPSLPAAGSELFPPPSEGPLAGTGGEEIGWI